MKKTVKAFLLSLSLTTTLFAATTYAQEDTKPLVDELLRYDNVTPSANLPQPTLGQAMDALLDAKATKPAACDESKKLNLAGHYVVTYGQNGPCRIYDLTFPTLRSAFAGAHVAKIPVQKFRASDYYNWMIGNYDQVYKNISDYKNSFTSDDLNSSWVGKIQFRNRVAGPIAGPVAGSTGARIAGVPKSFHASDLEVGNFQFDEQSHAQLSQILATQRALMSDAGASRFAMSASDAFWNGVINDPQTLLQKIRFDWNAADKVFDIVLEGGFLPISGPVVLIDYNTQYKAFVDSMTRSVVNSALRTLTNLIPEPTTRTIVRLGIDQTFGFIDQMYTNQTNRLEDTMREAIQGKIATEIPAADLDRGLNILFGVNGDILSQYLVTVVKGGKFDWTNLDKNGRDSRYAVEKQRDITNNNLHSKLVLKVGCDVQQFEDNFGICSKKGQKLGVYSFMSTTKILVWNLDPVRVYNYKVPAEISLRRSTSMLMATGLSVFKLPIPGFFVNKLVSALEAYASAAEEDESYLLNRLVMQKQTAGTVDTDSQDMIKWLFIQNMNPFLPKSEAGEQAIIAVNHSLLEKK